MAGSSGPKPVMRPSPVASLATGVAASPAPNPGDRAVTRSDLGDRLKQAYVALARGDQAAARHAYEGILKDHPRELDALLGLAFLERDQGRPEPARALYRRVLELQPGHLDAQLGLLAAAPETGLDDASATAMARDVAQAQPYSAAAQFVAGQVLARHGELAPAAVLLGRAFELQPTQANYAFNWAVALDRLGRQGQALKVYRAVLQLTARSEAQADWAQGVNLAVVRRRVEALQAALPAAEAALP